MKPTRVLITTAIATAFSLPLLTSAQAGPAPVPKFEHEKCFGIVKAAQARGDFQVLVERGRRALRVHLGSDLNSALNTLSTAVKEALS